MSTPRKSDQLLVCYGPSKRSLPATKQTLSRWIVDAISMSYESSGLPSHLGVKAHSTRSVSVWLCRIFVTLRVGLHRSLLSGSMTSMFILLLVPPSSCRSCATYIHTTQGLESLVAWSFSFPKRFDTARVPEVECLKVTYVTLVP